MSYGPGSVEAEMLHMYSQKDLLILCVRLAVLLAVTLTVPVVLFPVCGDQGGPWNRGTWVEGTGIDVWMDVGDRSG